MKFPIDKFIQLNILFQYIIIDDIINACAVVIVNETFLPKKKVS